MTIKNQAGGSNIVSTVDGFFRLGESHSLNAMLIHSTSTNTGVQGFAGFAQYFYSTNKAKIWLTQSVVTKDFNPEMGFVSRKDVIGTTPGINWYYRGRLMPFRKIIRAFEPGFLPEIYHQASTGKLIEVQLPIFPMWINFQNGSFIGYGINPSYQFLTEPFQPLGITIKAGGYHYIQQQVWLGSDASKILSVFGKVDWGTYFNGRLFTTDLNLQFAPIPNILIKWRFNRNQFTGVGEEKVNATVDLLSMEGRFALNPRVQLIGFYQQNTENQSKNYNIRLAWEYRPLSLYLFCAESAWI
jgi:hypothetical protein